MVNKVSTEVSLVFVGFTAFALLKSPLDKLFKFIFTNMFMNKSFQNSFCLQNHLTLSKVRLLTHNGRVQKYVTRLCSILSSTMVTKYL